MSEFPDDLQPVYYVITGWYREIANPTYSIPHSGDKGIVYREPAPCTILSSRSKYALLAEHMALSLASKTKIIRAGVEQLIRGPLWYDLLRVDDERKLGDVNVNTVEYKSLQAIIQMARKTGTISGMFFDTDFLPYGKELPDGAGDIS